ncbi:MAG: heterodisulfide reductase-related iron-sulfur binding cluster [Bryobacteraceae bacterium]|jgi:glycolate oxidase iron-sulfur subunit
MAVSEPIAPDQPRQTDLDRCVHCGLCLNACPTYRELRVEMDSPRGRIYQMAQVASGAAPISPSYIEHIDLCLACRGCETACPSGVRYGRLVEAARAQIESTARRPWHTRWLRAFFFQRILPSRLNLGIVGTALYLYQASGLQWLVRILGFLPSKLREIESLTPDVEAPFFFPYYGKVLPAKGPQRYRVAFLGGCIANFAFARLNEATLRVLQRNGCEVSIPEAQTCCGALHCHAGLPNEARKLARRNIDALAGGNFDAIITNAAGCGSTLKEYGELLEHDPEYAEKARQFSGRMKDVNEFLASIELSEGMRQLPITVTYQDSCHLAHGQRVRSAPRKLLNSVPGLQLREMALSDLCCGSAGIYNIVHTSMATALLRKKMDAVNATQSQAIVTANPGCMLQLRAGVRKFGKGQRVAHVVEILDEAYGKQG